MHSTGQKKTARNHWGKAMNVLSFIQIILLSTSSNCLDLSEEMAKPCSLRQPAEISERSEMVSPFGKLSVLRNPQPRRVAAQRCSTSRHAAQQRRG